MSHATHMNESCHIYEWDMSHAWMSHVTRMNESCHTHEWVMSHIWMGNVAQMNESWHTCECVIAHIWMSHGTRMNESWHTYEWVMAHICMSHGTPEKRGSAYEWLSKEPYVYVKRALCICQKSPMYITWEERSPVPCRQVWCCQTQIDTVCVRQVIG